MKKARIVERTRPDGTKIWVIQQRHWLLPWLWVGAGWNGWHPYDTDTFYDLESARANLCWYDGTRTTERVVE